MKKRIISLIVCATMALGMMGCGKGNTDTETALRSGQMEINANDYVKKLCDYTAIPVTISGDFTVSDDTVTKQLESLLSYYDLLTTKVEDRTVVQAGDVVEISYVGKNSAGEAFQGGTSQANVKMDIDNNYDMTNKSNYITGFCDKLAGASVGDTVITPVTFPENYSNKELAGQPATFEITVHGIYTKLTADALTDQMVADNFASLNLSTKDELINYVRNYVTYQNENSRMSAVAKKVEEYLIANCEVEVPEDYYNARLNEYVEQITKNYVPETSTLDEFLQSQNVDKDEMMKSWGDSLTTQIKLELIFTVIAEKENLEVDAEGYREFVNNYVNNSSYGYKDTEAVYKDFGNGYSDEGKQYVEKLYRIRQAMSFVCEKAQVTNESDNAGDASSTEGAE